MNNSNISIQSNIYPISTEKPFSDENFMSVVYNLQALEKLKESGRIPNDIQRKILQRGSYCSFHPHHNSTFGVIKRDNKYFEVTRCDVIDTCRYAETHNCHVEKEIQDDS